MLPPGTWRHIAIAGFLTLVVTLVRLAGEVYGWDERWFGTEAGGGNALVGISWLVLPFGWVFGRHVVRAGAPPASRLAAVIWPVVGIGLAIGAISALFHFLPEPTFTGFLAICVTGVVCGAIARRGWPVLWRTNLLYGLAARLPVIAITPIAVMKAWGTHYEKLAPGSPAVSDAARITILCTAQVFLWLPFTLLVGGLAGGIAAALTRCHP
jgi:hypothetical protein